MSRGLEYRIEAIDLWPGERTPEWKRTRSNFKTIWSKVETHLAREVRALNGRNVVIRLQVSSHDLRLDGMLRSSARPREPGVVVQFQAQKLKGSPTLFYRCDRFRFWQDNVSAVARGLEALRLVDRYGVTPMGEQYAGFKALPASTAPTMTVEVAGTVIAPYHSKLTIEEVIHNPAAAKEATRSALHATHPDRNNGERAAFDNVDAARKVLSAHHGVSL